MSNVYRPLEAVGVADPLETRPLFTWVIMPNLIAVGTWSNGTSIRAEIRLKKIRSSRPGFQGHSKSSGVTGRTTTCDFLFVVRGNYRQSCVRDKRQFRSKTRNFPTPCI